MLPSRTCQKTKKKFQQDNIFPIYQPQVKSDTQEIIGVEPLTRWHNSKLGPISPDVFIPVAKESNLIEKLTEKLIVRIFHDLHKILETNTAFTVSINISTELLTSDTLFTFSTCCPPPTASIEAK
ncbi:MAG: sensor c-di-GMP phosphodiesterase-like protein [Methylophilaceae bacterium]